MTTPEAPRSSACMIRIGSFAPTRASTGTLAARVAIRIDRSSAPSTGACSPSAMKKSKPVPAITSAVAESANVSHEPRANRLAPMRSWKSGTIGGIGDMAPSVRRRPVAHGTAPSVRVPGRPRYSHAMSAKVASPLSAQELAAVRRPFRGATLLPARTYHDPAIFTFEREQWFFRDWICVGREEDAPDPGSYFTVELIGEPLIVVRGPDDRLRAFYNVCRHRGTAVVEGDCGKLVRMQCPYHAWIYDLEGRLVRAKHMEDIEDFSLGDFGLTAVRLEAWGGFLFVNL